MQCSCISLDILGLSNNTGYALFFTRDNDQNTLKMRDIIILVKKNICKECCMRTMMNCMTFAVVPIICFLNALLGVVQAMK